MEVIANQVAPNKEMTTIEAKETKERTHKYKGPVDPHTTQEATSSLSEETSIKSKTTPDAMTL